LVGVINKHAEGLIASFLPADYGELKAGIYVAGIGDYHPCEEDVVAEIEDALDILRFTDLLRVIHPSSCLNP